jgi:GAF domain-containing protein
MVPVIVPVNDPIRARTVIEGGAFNAEPGETWTGRVAHVREAMVGPLVGEKGVLGALTIINRLGEGTHFEPDDLRLLETVANQAAVALENGQLEQSLHELSLLKDNSHRLPRLLTGLANRPAFVEESCR